MSSDTTQTTQLELLSCMFCGREVVMDRFGHTDDNPKWTASCENESCGAIGPEGKSRQEAAEKWNRVSRA